jgi:hypothetical protein
MAYYFKGAQILAPFTISSNEPVFEVDTVSLSIQRASQGAQRWEISFTTVTTEETQADMLVGTVTNLTTADTMVMPQLPSVVNNNTAGVNLVVSTAQTAGASNVTVVSDGVIQKGSFIKFSNHDKLYMVTADVSAGTAPISIHPKLRKAVATTDTMLTGDSVLLTYFRDIDNLTGLTFTDGILSNAGTITLVESV